MEKNKTIRKILAILFLSILLLIMDTIISAILGCIYTSFKNREFNIYSLNIASSSFIILGVIRFVYYYMFFVFLFYCFNGVLNFRNKLLQLVILNCGLYILISLFYAFVLKPRYAYYLKPLIIDLFINPLFYTIVLSTIFSPLILNKTPCFKRFISDL